jgi:hypothetical protein
VSRLYSLCTAVQRGTLRDVSEPAPAGERRDGLSTALLEATLTSDHRSDDPEVEAVATVGGVLTDLVNIAERLPVAPGQAEALARILDRLSTEISEAAAMLRRC